jgi:hypothetical protein
VAKPVADKALRYAKVRFTQFFPSPSQAALPIFKWWMEKEPIFCPV